jgi:hypothetical protein
MKHKAVLQIVAYKIAAGVIYFYMLLWLKTDVSVELMKYRAMKTEEVEDIYLFRY